MAAAERTRAAAWALVAALLLVPAARAVAPSASKGVSNKVSREALPVPPAPPAPPAPPVLPDVLRVRVVPDLEPVRRAFAAANTGTVRTRFDVHFDARGRVTEATLLLSTGDEALDAFLVEWVKGVVVETRMAGRGRLPFVFEWEGSGNDLPTPPEPVFAAARRAGMSVIPGELAMRHSPDGRWTPSLRRGTGHPDVDAALLTWAATLTPAYTPNGFVSYVLDIPVPPAP